MDFEAFDSSGTDDDLPPSHQNRLPRGGRLAGNGRAAVVVSVPYPGMYGGTDMETEIHRLEQEAYSSVLRAFKAQADAISWDQEGLITELRKELRLSNEEHRELLSRVDAEDVIRRIRDWRHASGIQSGIRTGHDPVPSPTVSASRKKQKMTQSVPPQSFGRPSPPFHSQPVAPSNQPSSSGPKRGPLPVLKGKKHKSGQMLSGVSSMKSLQHPPSGPSGRSQIANRASSGAVANEHVEGAPINPLIGKRVKTRWPDDNNFYEAVITDYRPEEGRHALVYDMGTTNETWEWVNIAEISPGDIKWEDEDPGIPQRGNYGGAGRGLIKTAGRVNHPGAGRGRGLLKGQSRKDFPQTQNGIGKKVPDVRILHTDALIKEVERVFNSSNPDPVETEKAKRALKEQEHALIDAIERLADITDVESDDGDP